MLGVILGAERGAADPLLAGIAGRLAARGLAVAGTVQVTGPSGGMALRLLPDGPVVAIAQDLGPGAAGCTLDPAGVETAAGHVAARLAAGPLPALLIVNKFGRTEAGGRGFRPLIGAALAQGVPVLTAVRPDYSAAFAAFADGMAEVLPPDAGALAAWAARVTGG